MVYEAMILILAPSFLDGGFTNHPSEFPSRKGISSTENMFFSWLKHHNYNPTEFATGFHLKNHDNRYCWWKKSCTTWDGAETL